MARTGIRRARAFAPGHVTGLFAPALGARDPRGRGSVGAGLVLELGVVAEAETDPGARRSVRVTSDVGGPLPISQEVARRLSPTDAGRTRVHLVHQLPVGQGFGMSAAGALATALALEGLFGAPRSRSVEVAHLADLFGGGGLGGVAAILGGGREVRLRAGIPPWGEVRRFAHPSTVFVATVGPPIPSASVLEDPRRLARIRRAFDGWPGRGTAPGAHEFFRASERFSDAVGLASRDVRDAIRTLRAAGGWAAQAMFGESLFTAPRNPAHRAAVLRALTDLGVPAVEVAVPARGARRLGGPQPF